jgi:protoporphyrinogen oxidase
MHIAVIGSGIAGVTLAEENRKLDRHNLMSPC